MVNIDWSLYGQVNVQTANINQLFKTSMNFFIDVGSSNYVFGGIDTI